MTSPLQLSLKQTNKQQKMFISVISSAVATNDFWKKAEGQFRSMDGQGGLLGWLSGKRSACDAEDTGDAAGLISGSGRSPGGGRGNPLQCSCLRESHGQRALEGSSPRGHTVDTTQVAEFANTDRVPQNSAGHIQRVSLTQGGARQSSAHTL